MDSTTGLLPPPQSPVALIAVPITALHAAMQEAHYTTSDCSSRQSSAAFGAYGSRYTNVQLGQYTTKNHGKQPNSPANLPFIRWRGSLGPRRGYHTSSDDHLMYQIILQSS